MGEMVLQDARRILALGVDIKALDQKIALISASSELAETIGSIPGFGKTSRAELAGEIGNMERFDSVNKLGSVPEWTPVPECDKKHAEGKAHNQAVRALGRHLVRVIWSMVKQGRKYEIR